MRDLSEYTSRIFGEERAFERSINTAHIESIISNVLGSNPKLRLRDWRDGSNVEPISLSRDEAWNQGETGNAEEEAADSDIEEIRFGKGEPPPGMLDRERGRHSDIEVSTFIDDPLWNRAGWRATFFGVSPPGTPPMLGLGFRNKEAAIAIFAEWRRRLGEVDRSDDLRISILTGVDKENPAAYAVIVGGKLRRPKNESQLIVTASRINRMTPANSRNLDMFLAAYSREKRYILVPAHFDETAQSVQPLNDYSVGKREISVRPMWQVGDNDPDFVAIDEDDDPIVPKDATDVPVVRALARIRSRSQKRS